ncbi:MAG: hypothetical protein WC558_05515 [Patulibacter sp.]
MFQFRSSMAASAVTVALGLSLVAVAPAVAADQVPATKTAAKAAKKKTKKAAAPKTVTACVNNRTGTTKVLLGKKAKRKCPKGSTKMTWNVTGPKGADGKNGANGANGANGLPGANGGALAVRDAAGNRIGTFAGALSLGSPVPIVQVFGADGGLYTYFESGQLLPSGLLGGGSMSPLFYDPSCAGPAYLSSSPGSADLLSAFAGGTARIVYRYSTGSSFTNLGPARVWKFTTTTTIVPAVSPAAYQLDSSGVCAPVSSGDEPDPGDVMVALEAVQAPPDGVGRLVIG